MTTTTMNGTAHLIDDDPDIAAVTEATKTIDQIKDEADEASHISVPRIINTIQALAIVAHGLDYSPKLELLHATLDPLIAKFPVDERGPFEAPLRSILSTGADLEKFLQAIPAPATGPVFTPFSFDDLMNMPPKQWLINQVIGVNDLGVIYGGPGTGKTFVGINMIVSACTGSQWAGRFDIVRSLNVAYCAGEGISGLPARFRAATEMHGIKKLPNFYFYRNVPQLFVPPEERIVNTLRQFADEWRARQNAGLVAGLDLLFVDTLSTATIGAKENDSTDMNRVADYCRTISQMLNCAIILIHHSNKAGTAERGSTALRGAADLMIEIRRESESTTRATMKCSKLKDGEQWKDQPFDLHKVEGCNSVCVLWDDPTDSSTQAAGQKQADKNTLADEMLRYAGQRFTAKKLAEVIDKRENYTRNLLNELVKVGLCQRELEKPNQKESSRNPWVFFIAATQGELSAEQESKLSAMGL